MRSVYPKLANGDIMLLNLNTKRFKVDFCYEKYLDILTHSKQRELCN
jgi:hypothetical protein